MSSSAMAREARRRRRDLGLSQSRVARSLGVSTSQVGRWERGEEIPASGQLHQLGELIGLTPEQLELWAGETGTGQLAGPVPIEILAARSGPSDPWGFPLDRSPTPPMLDREALIGRTHPAAADSASRTSRRRGRREERRLRRRSVAARREARREESDAARHRLEEEARQQRTGPLPMVVPGGLAARVAAPSGVANTGSVFPVPDTRRRSETVTYRSVEGGAPPDERMTYVGRVILTIVVFIGLLALLWWALGAFGDGVGSVLDLFRGDQSEPGQTEGALQLTGWV